MKLSKTWILLCSFLFCILTVTTDKIQKDDKINLQIKLVNKDELLSSPHLKIKKSILHNGKKINIKVFEKINENVLERAYIVEEVDKTKSLTAAEKKELLTLKNENFEGQEEEEEENIETDDEESKTEDEDDGKMKLISSEESKENDIHMIRKVYKETKGNKEITYCYMIFTFNLDLEKMNEVSKSELFKSLDSMPDYLSFLSPNEKISDTETLLEEEYEQTENGTGKKSSLGGISATELSHKSEDIKVNIPKYIRTLDNIINYLVGKLEKTSEYPKFYKELINEREYLYNLSLEKTENENIVNGEYWKNKSKIEKYILYEVLTQLSTVYFTGMMKNTFNNERDASSEYNKFIDLIEKSMQCHSVLDNTEILDVIILQKFNKSEKKSDNQNKVDTDLIQQCLSLFKLLLSNKEEFSSYKNHETPMNNENEIKNELNELSEEEFPAEEYMLKKETSDIDSLMKPSEEDSSKTYEDDEDLDLMDKDVTEDEDEYEDELYEVDAEKLNDEIEAEIAEQNEEEKNGSFLENDDKIINSDISTEMYNEDPDIANETEEEHKNEILDIIHLEEQKMLDDDINSPIEKDITPHNEMSSSYLENEAMTEDDDDDDDEDEENEDMLSLDDDDDDSFFSDETDDDDNDTTDDNETVEDFEDSDDTDSDEESLDLDEDDEDDEDDEVDNDDEDSNEKFTDKIKKSLKKEFKNALNTGKEMGKKALSNLADKAEGQVQKLTSKMSKKLKEKLNGKKNKKSKKGKKENKSKKVKKGIEKKNVKKNNSKGNKKTKKNDKTNGESNDASVKKSSKSKPKNKKKKTSTSSTKPKSNKKLRKSDKKKGTFISLSTEAYKVPLSGKMNRTLAKITEEMTALKVKKNKLLRDLEEPSVSDEKIIDNFEEYEDRIENKKGANIRKLKSDKRTCK